MFAQHVEDTKPWQPLTQFPSFLFLSFFLSFFLLSFFLSFLLFPISKDYPSPFPRPLFNFSIFCPKNSFWPFKNLKENQKVQIWFAYNFNIPLTPIAVLFYPFVIYNLWCTKHSHTSTITHRHTLNRKWALNIISLPYCSLYRYFFLTLESPFFFQHKHIIRSRTNSPCWTKEP